MKVRNWAVWALGLASVLSGSDTSAVEEVSRFKSYDARIELQAGVGLAPGVAQKTEEAALRSHAPGLQAEYDSVTGALRSLYNTAGTLSESIGERDAFLAARDWLYQHQALLGLTLSDLDGLEETDRVVSRSSGALHLYLRQTHGGLSAYNGQLQVHFNRDGEILSVNNGLLPGLAQAVNTLVPAVDAAAAVSGAIQHLGLKAAPPKVIDGAFKDAGRSRVSHEGLSLEPIDAQLMLLPIRAGEARLVWRFELHTLDQQHVFDFTVDAVTAQVWTRFDQVAQDSYLVYPQPTESPNHAPPGPPTDTRQTALNPANSAASPFGWHDTNGSTGAEFTIMRGNNVHAYEDSNGNGAPPATQPDCGAGLNCVFPLDLTLAPSTYRPAAVANLFYWNNVIHDVQFQYGFDSAGGNFQVNTYGGGGVGGDDVRAEAQDGGALNNANFFTPADGSRPRMQMYLWNTASPFLDGDLDAGVIAHEYGHGISNRMVGGPANVGCLSNLQQAGEGISDWFSLVYTHQLGDEATDGRGIGTYVLNQATNGPGIRTQRYSTDPTVNTWTYASINGMGVPHGVGSVFAQAAWEAYWALVDHWGFDPYLYDAAGGAGNQRMLLYLTQGLQFTNCSPTFTDLRDGIIQAAMVNYGGVDVCRLWTAFANFGLGTDAISGGPNSLSPTNGFAVPATCETDVWSKDRNVDTGLEPDPATAGLPMWQSQDIWVRNDATAGSHQNPEFGQTNYINVRVRNRGSVDGYNVPIKLYVANASTGLAWPTDWTFVGQAVVPNLPPLGVTSVMVPWNPAGVGHYCIISRIDTGQDPMTFPEGPNVNVNTRQNNNIVWRNTNVVDLVPFQFTEVSVKIRNIQKRSVKLRIRFQEPRGQRATFMERGRITVDLGAKLASLWREQGAAGKGFRVLKDTVLELQDLRDTFIEVALKPRQEFDLGLVFEDLAFPDKPTEPGDNGIEVYQFDVVQEIPGAKEAEGGVSYEIFTRRR